MRIMQGVEGQQECHCMQREMQRHCPWNATPQASPGECEKTMMSPSVLRCRSSAVRRSGATLAAASSRRCWSRKGISTTPSQSAPAGREAKEGGGAKKGTDARSNEQLEGCNRECVWHLSRGGLHRTARVSVSACRHRILAEYLHRRVLIQHSLCSPSPTHACPPCRSGSLLGRSRR